MRPVLSYMDDGDRGVVSNIRLGGSTVMIDNVPLVFYPEQRLALTVTRVGASRVRYDLAIEPRVRGWVRRLTDWAVAR